MIDVLKCIHKNAKDYEFLHIEKNSFSNIRADYEIFIDRKNKGNSYIFAKKFTNLSQVYDIKIEHGAQFRYVVFQDVNVLLMYSTIKEVNSILLIKHRKYIKNNTVLKEQQ